MNRIMVANSYSWREHLILSVSMTLTILLDVEVVGSLPLGSTFHSPVGSQMVEDESEGRLGSNEQLVKIREPDKSLLRAIALVIGGLLTVSTVICLCAMYWCMCWTLQCPGFLHMEHLIQVASNACSRLRLTSRSRRSSNSSKSKKKRRSLIDPPPSYEFILTQQIPGERNGADQEIPPPSYTDALCKESHGVL